MQWNGASLCEFNGKSIETRQKHDQNFPKEGKQLLNKYQHLKERNPKEQDCENHSLGSKYES